MKDDKGNKIKRNSVVIDTSKKNRFYFVKNKNTCISIEARPIISTLDYLKANGYIKVWIN